MEIYILLKKTDWIKKLTVSYNDFDMECWIYDFPYLKFTKLSLRKTINNIVLWISCFPLNLQRCHCGKYFVLNFVFSLLFLNLRRWHWKKKWKQSDIGVVYTSGVLFWNHRKICVSVDSDIHYIIIKRFKDKKSPPATPTSTSTK